MAGKKNEGNEQQRRAAAREARAEGTSPSARKETTGASKQREHLPRQADHDEKIAAVHRGKQWWSPDVEGRETGLERPSGPASEEYTRAHEQVLTALADQQEARGGEGAYLDDIARGSGLPRQRTREVLHDLTASHRLVTEVQGTSDDPDLGPRYEIKPRLSRGEPQGTGASAGTPAGEPRGTTMTAPAHDDLPLRDYDHLPVPAVGQRIRSLTADQVGTLLDYERAHADRPAVTRVLQARLGELREGAEPSGGAGQSGPDYPEAARGTSAAGPETSGPPAAPPPHGLPAQPARPKGDRQVP